MYLFVQYDDKNADSLHRITENWIRQGYKQEFNMKIFKDSKYLFNMFLIENQPRPGVN